MKKRQINSKAIAFVALAVLALAIVGSVIVVVMTAPRAAGPAAQAGDPPPVTASLQPAVILLEATRIPVPLVDTAYPTTIVGILPSVVATGTYVWSAPTPDPTDLAEGLHHEYLTNLLYNAPATIVAQGSNTTPFSSTVYTEVTLTTYRVEEVHLPNDETWLTILPHADGGLGVGSVTFTKPGELQSMVQDSTSLIPPGYCPPTLSYSVSVSRQLMVWLRLSMTVLSYPKVPG